MTSKSAFVRSEEILPFVSYGPHFFASRPGYDKKYDSTFIRNKNLILEEIFATKFKQNPFVSYGPHPLPPEI